MRKDGLGKVYDRFSPDERFRLLVEALVRADEVEVGRLAETCLRERYTTIESAYTDRIRISAQMTMAVCTCLAPRLAKLEALAALREGVSYIFEACIAEADLAYLTGEEVGAQRSWLAAGKTGDPPDKGKASGTATTEGGPRGMIADFLKEMTGGFLTHIEELERSIAADALITWEAFSCFCNDVLLVDAEKLVKVWVEPMLPKIAGLTELPNPRDIDQQKVEQHMAALKRVWSEFVR